MAPASRSLGVSEPNAAGRTRHGRTELRGLCEGNKVLLPGTITVFRSLSVAILAQGMGCTLCSSDPPCPTLSLAALGTWWTMVAGTLVAGLCDSRVARIRVALTMVIITRGSYTSDRADGLPDCARDPYPEVGLWRCPGWAWQGVTGHGPCEPQFGCV